MPPGHSYVVPSVAAQDTRWDVTPRAGSVTAIGVRVIEAERCRIGSRWPYCPRTGRSHCGSTHPLAVLSPGRSLSDVIGLTASAGLVPLRYHTGAVYLVTPEDAARYEELGGQGEYIAGSAGERAMARRLGPCLNPAHLQQDVRSTPHPLAWAPYSRELERQNRQNRERDRARLSAAESHRSWVSSTAARTNGRCRLLEVGREGCGCKTCLRELSANQGDRTT
jgi:hypothetical protein